MPWCTVSHGTCAHIRRQKRILFFVLYKDRPDFSFARHFNLLPFEGLPSQRFISRNDLPLLASYARVMYGWASFRWQNQLSPKWRQIEPRELAIDIHEKRIVFLSSTCKPLEQIADVKSSIMRIRWRTELFGKVVGTTFDRDKGDPGWKEKNLGTSDGIKPFARIYFVSPADSHVDDSRVSLLDWEFLCIWNVWNIHMEQIPISIPVF